MELRRILTAWATELLTPSLATIHSTELCAAPYNSATPHRSELRRSYKFRSEGCDFSLNSPFRERVTARQDTRLPLITTLYWSYNVSKTTLAYQFFYLPTLPELLREQKPFADHLALSLYHKFSSVQQTFIGFFWRATFGLTGYCSITLFLLWVFLWPISYLSVHPSVDTFAPPYWGEVGIN